MSIFNNLNFVFQGVFRMEALNLGTLSECIILLHAIHDCPGGKTAAITHHMSFVQITCFKYCCTRCCL